MLSLAFCNGEARPNHPPYMLGQLLGAQNLPATPRCWVLSLPTLTWGPGRYGIIIPEAATTTDPAIKGAWAALAAMHPASRGAAVLDYLAPMLKAVPPDAPLASELRLYIIGKTRMEKERLQAAIYAIDPTDPNNPTDKGDFMITLEQLKTRWNAEGEA